MDSFDYAIQMERDGSNFYSQSIALLQDEAARRMLRELARDEQQHEKCLQKAKTGEKVDFDISVATTIKNVFEELIETECTFLNEDDSFSDILRRGIEIERMSVKLYDGFAQKAQPDQEKDFWTKLRTIEQKHEKLLSITLEHIDSPRILLENAEFLFYTNYN